MEYVFKVRTGLESSSYFMAIPARRIEMWNLIPAQAISGIARIAGETEGS